MNQVDLINQLISLKSMLNRKKENPRKTKSINHTGETGTESEFFSPCTARLSD
jgi:hypothetical protein